MPALPPVTGVIRIDLIQTDITALPLGNRLFWAYSGSAPDNAACTALAGSIRGSADTNFVPLMASGDIETSVKVTDLSDPAGGVGISSGSSTSTRSGGALPMGTALVMSYLIARKYRGGKPRTYFQWGTSADLNTQRAWGTSFTGACNTAMAAFTTAVNGFSSGGCSLSNPANVSYYQGFNTVGPDAQGRFRYPPKLRTAPHVDVITGHVAQLTVGSQRRRYGR